MNKADEVYSILPEEPFRFSCGPHLDCFNECCRDLNQYLTPYDVLRLKTHLGMTSSTFLATYTLRHDGPVTGLPVVTLRPREGAAKRCPFVDPEGCRVYADRPGSCRMYPVARMAGRDRVTGLMRENFMLIREAHCRGFEDGPERTVRSWMEDQGVGPYNAANDKMIEIIGLSQGGSGATLRNLSDWIYTLLYDLDYFRDSIMSGPTGPHHGLIDLAREAINDEALLDAALELVAGRLRQTPLEISG